MEVELRETRYNLLACGATALVNIRRRKLNEHAERKVVWSDAGGHDLRETTNCMGARMVMLVVNFLVAISARWNC